MSASGKFKKYFYAASSPECDRSSHLFKPAVAFEVHNGISGISGDYCLPYNFSASEYEEYTAKKYYVRLFSNYEDPLRNGFKIIPKEEVDTSLVKEIMDHWLELKKLNSSLDEITFESCSASVLPVVLYDAIAGCACLLNTKDINHFIRLRIQTERFDILRIFTENTELADLYNKINETADYPIRWVPSPYTLEVIKSKLDNRNNIRPGPALSFE